MVILIKRQLSGKYTMFWDGQRVVEGKDNWYNGYDPKPHSIRLLLKIIEALDFKKKWTLGQHYDDFSRCSDYWAWDDEGPVPEMFR